MYDISMSQDLNNLAAMLLNQSPTALKKIQAKLRKDAKILAKASSPGHVEPEIKIPMDRVGSNAMIALSKKEIFEQKSNEYADLFLENPSLREQVEAYVPQPKPLTKQQIWYASRKANREAQKAEAKALALETLSALAGENLDSIGRRKHLTAFQKEVLEHLKIAALMGVEIPFLFEGNIDPKLEALKLEATLIKHEGDSEDLDSIIESMSLEERAAYQAVAAEVLNNLNPKLKGE
jgi:uncharacterized protein (DUF736 family)